MAASPCICSSSTMVLFSFPTKVKDQNARSTNVFNNCSLFSNGHYPYLIRKTDQRSLPTSAILCCSLPRQKRLEYHPSYIPDSKYVRMFDTSLRDGEQSPGATMTTEEKLEIARQLTRLGADIIEAGFPASSDNDFEAVKLIAIEVGNNKNSDDDDGEDCHVPVICGLARCNKRDIDKAWEAVKFAMKPRIHTFIATSKIHMEYKLKMTPDEVIAKATSMVAYARSLGCDDVQFSAEDAGRSDREFLYRILGEVIKSGATTINIPDTVGCTLFYEYGQLIADIISNTPGIENVIISTHCHNDLGLATANTLAGVHAGARQVEVTVNGIGERAGNAALEEVAVAIYCRQEVLDGLWTGIDLPHITMASKMVEKHSGLRIQPHKAIVGDNSHKHASGIHQDGMLKHPTTYEFMADIDIGQVRASESGIVLGKLSGRKALKARMLELGYDIDGKELDNLFGRFKDVAGNKKNLTDDDLIALVADEVFQPQVFWKLADVQVTCGTGLSTATVKLIDVQGDEHIACSDGTGPVDAAYKAVNLIVKVPVTLCEYSMNAVTEGIDAIASTRVLIRPDDSRSATSTHATTGESVNRAFSGTGAAMDIVISSVRAYISALNKMIGFENCSKHVGRNDRK